MAWGLSSMGQALQKKGIVDCKGAQVGQGVCVELQMDVVVKRDGSVLGDAWMPTGLPTYEQVCVQYEQALASCMLACGSCSGHHVSVPGVQYLCSPGGCVEPPVMPVFRPGRCWCICPCVVYQQL
jgi:hypothetical protein